MQKTNFLLSNEEQCIFELRDTKDAKIVGTSNQYQAGKMKQH